MTKDTSSHFSLSYGTLSPISTRSEYSREFQKRGLVARMEPIRCRSEIDITQAIDDDSKLANASTYRGAFPPHSVDHHSKHVSSSDRSKSHFAMAYSNVPMPRTEYSDEFKANSSFPKRMSLSAPRSDRVDTNIFPTECEHTDYTSETKRAYVYVEPTIVEDSSMTSASKLRESHFSLGSKTESSKLESTSHSHYAKRPGLGGRSSLEDPEIIALRQELSRSHFSLCDE